VAEQWLTGEDLVYQEIVLVHVLQLLGIVIQVLEDVMTLGQAKDNMVV
jgi:hypothetical protein